MPSVTSKEVTQFPTFKTNALTKSSALRVLFVDAYDSFSNNVIGLLQSTLDAEVTTVKIDHVFAVGELESFVQTFDAIVIGPGPGDPLKASDIGFVPQIWQLSGPCLIPVLGICLGHQSLAAAFGADVDRLQEPRHGIATEIQHCKRDIFESMGPFNATQYHSLYVDLGHAAGLTVNHPSLWRPSAKCPEIKPLAWDATNPDRPICMAIRHLSKPFWSMQFHPESCYTTPKVRKVIQNWGAHVRTWHASHQSKRATPSKAVAGTAFNNTHSTSHTPISSSTSLSGRGHRYKSCKLDSIDTCAIFEACKAQGWSPILLDSQGHFKGRFSIIGLAEHEAGMLLQYSVRGRTLVTNNDAGSRQERCDLEQVWRVLQSTLDERKAAADGSFKSEIPFWGGWIGYISYEAGLETIDVEPSTTAEPSMTPDVNFRWTNRSVVIDHGSRTVYVQSLLDADDQWMQETVDTVTRVNAAPQPDLVAQDEMDVTKVSIERPTESSYRSSVLRCQDFLKSGDSYELCLTGQTDIRIPADVKPWRLYKRLRRTNPAPFGAFIQLPGATIVGSSPERFLSWSRNGRCRMEPIKGTVRKSPDMTLKQATEILSTSKERAENLMIVDLIRHDLSGACGSGNVNVERLMQVEEFETVYQLVSVIEAQLPAADTTTKHSSSQTGSRNKAMPSHSGPATCGLDVLKVSLPPGSMTGAPKKRSCEILAGLENRSRGIYSGVIGYMDVGGGGDFSVVIRTMFRPDANGDQEGAEGENEEEDSSEAAMNTWHIGAGGAVTIQSTDKGEFDEMETKLDSVLRMFQ